MSQLQQGLALNALMIGATLFLGQLFAFFAGLQAIGVATWAALLLIPLIALLREVAALPLTVIGYLGATLIWGWDWWQALALSSAFFIITVPLYLFLTNSSLALRIFRITRADRIKTEISL